MSFLKSYYDSVSSYLSGDEISENSEITNVDSNESSECKLKESKSEGWLKGIYSGAYSQSGELWKAVKTDLTEFATVISKDAKTVVVKTAMGMKNGIIGSEENPELESGEQLDNPNTSTSKIRASISRMLDQVSKALYIPPESDDEDYYDNSDGSQQICNRIETRIINLQRNRKTYESDPDVSEIDPDLGDFSQWKAELNLDDFQTTIAELVKTNETIFDFYAELVPRKLTHDEFWSRYFYRVASINSEESRRQALKLRITHDANLVKETDSCDWDEGNDICDESEVPNNMTTVQNHSSEEVADQQFNLKSTTDDMTSNDSSLKVTEKNDIILVKHSIESSSASEDNNPDVYKILDQKEVEDEAGWDDDIDVDVNEEDIKIAMKTSEAEVMESKWDDWS